MTGQLSTRMGAAIRHAGHHLKLQRSAKKLLIVITDGEPTDINKFVCQKSHHVIRCLVCARHRGDADLELMAFGFADGILF